VKALRSLFSLAAALPLAGAALLPAEAQDPALLKPGDLLPRLAGKFLTDREVVLPEAAAGKLALLALGFSYNSRFAVEEWTGRFRQEFRSQEGVIFFEIPMLGGLARLARPFIDGGMRKGTPQELHENVITVYGGGGPWKKRTGYRDPDAAYLILIDEAGHVAWLHAGAFQEAAFGELARVIRERRR
jgi:hypothetical protein